MTNNLPRSVLELPIMVRAEMALRKAVRGALEESARLGISAHIWRDGKVVAVSPDEIREYLAKPEPPLATLQSATNGAPDSGSKPE